MSGSSHPVQKGDTLLTNMHYSQAVRIGDRVEISGQGGWDDEFGFPVDLRDEIVAAFDNMERALATAGATWRDVIAVNSYVLAADPAAIVDGHNPVMVIAVLALGALRMRVEIRVSVVVQDAD